jgi:CRP-like cAMP-binding protein
MAELLLIVNRDRADVFEALKRSRVPAERVAVLFDRRRQEHRRRSGAPSVERRGGDRRSQDVAEDLVSLGFAAVSASSTISVTPRAEEATRLMALNSASVPADTTAFFESLDSFKGFTRDQLGVLARSVSERTLPKGQALFREGEKGGEMFFVRQGTIVISKAVTGNIEKVLARMGPSEFFGEMSLFGGLSRSATAWTETGAVLLGLTHASLQQVIELSPHAGLAFLTSIIREFSKRLADTDDLVAEVTRWGLEATDVAVDLEP